jgi:hypothetical protein
VRENVVVLAKGGGIVAGEFVSEEKPAGRVVKDAQFEKDTGEPNPPKGVTCMVNCAVEPTAILTVAGAAFSRKLGV